MDYAFGEKIVVCRPHMDAWSRFFARCPVCKTRRLCLEEFQDYYGEYRPAPKRERAKIVADAKARIKSYIEAGIPQGYKAFMARLEAELAQRRQQETAAANAD